MTRVLITKLCSILTALDNSAFGRLKSWQEGTARRLDLKSDLKYLPAISRGLDMIREVSS
jgi:hypothetical protein